MDLLKTVRQRSVLSEVIYIALNLALAVAVFLAIWALESPVIALVVVLLSKWRVLAVRPRYWAANVQANMVDIIVSFGFVGLLFYAGTLPAQIVITLLYMGWLFFLKPRSKRMYMVAQAHVATIVGIAALFHVSYSWPSTFVVLLMWLIGYSAARHVLTAYEEKQVTFISMVWGFVVAQLGWLAHHWSIAYELPGTGGLLIAQVAIIVTFIGFLCERLYASLHRHGEVKLGDILLPAILSISVIIIIQLLFNSIGAGAI